jgi:hypothetical protein
VSCVADFCRDAIALQRANSVKTRRPFKSVDEQ